MLCPKCGAINLDERWRCWSCQAELQNNASSSKGNKSSGEPHMPNEPLQIPDEPSRFLFDDSPPTPPNQKEKPKNSFTLQDLIEKNLQNNIPDNHKDVEADRFSIGFRTNHDPGNYRKNWRRIFLAGFILLVIVLVVFLTLNRATKSSATELYSRAEEALTFSKYQKATELYEKLIHQYPGDVLTPVARKRLKEIQDDLAFLETHGVTRSEYIQQLLGKAERAFQRQRFTVPPKDNVLYYTREILHFDPANSRALELQASMIQYYENKAAEALKKRRYRTARRFYQRILLINPNDTQTQAKLARLQKRFP